MSVTATAAAATSRMVLLVVDCPCRRVCVHVAVLQETYAAFRFISAGFSCERDVVELRLFAIELDISKDQADKKYDSRTNQHCFLPCAYQCIFVFGEDFINLFA